MNNCKAGDLAVITHDVESCAGNIGKIVKVGGPAARNKDGQITWLIRPADGKPYMLCNGSGEFVRMMRPDDWDIEHPDKWMMPLHAESDKDGLMVDERDAEEEFSH